MDYDIFSRYYDLLNTDLDYKGGAQYLMQLFLRYDRLPKLLLDVGCGTGGFSIEFAKAGVQVIGVDPSFGMLSVAAAKAKERGTDILFLNQSGQELDLYGTVDGAICCLDTVNHIICKRELQAFFNRIALFLEQDRLFIFDVNTLYKQQHILGDSTFVIEEEALYCVWRNSFDKRRECTDICLDFFEEKNGAYIKSREEFSERVYSESTLRAMLEKAGFTTLAVLGEASFSPPGKNSQRNIFVARKGV